MSPQKILIAEDDPGIISVLEYNLQADGYQTMSVQDGLLVRGAVLEFQPDLILLDLMMPGQNGFDTCKQLKADPETAFIPLIIMTVRSGEPDVVLGLGLGAEDYVTKPFSMRILQARIKNALRREKPVTPADERIVRGVLEIDPMQREVRVAGTAVVLTKMEFDLLRFLAKKPGRVYSRNDILHGCWPDGVFVVDRSVDVHVASLRKKLGGAGDYIETSRGVGYRFVMDSQSAPSENS